MKQTKYMIALGILTASSVFAADTGISICTNQQNILAERIAGTWVDDSDLNARLGSKFDEKGFSIDEIKYTIDENATTYFPDHSMLKGLCAYTAGFMSAKFTKKGEARTFRTPYVVVNLNGNPAILFDEKGDSDGTDKVNDLHIGYMMVARAATIDGDVLFQGGDHNNQRLFALKRLIME